MITKNFRNIFTFLFIVLIIILSKNARFAADDYFFIYLSNTFGPIKGALLQYNTFSGRFLTHIVSCYLLQFSNSSYFLPIYFCLTFLILYYALSAIYFKIYSLYSIEELKFNSDFTPLLFLTTFFFSSFSIGESWFWFISTTTYLWNIIAALILINIVLKNKLRLASYFLIVCCSLYIGFSSESFALIYLAVILFFILREVTTMTVESVIKNPTVRILFFIFLIIISSLLISLFSPGSQTRNSLLIVHSFSEKLIISAKSIIKIFIFYLPSKSLYFIILSLPWLVFGRFIQIEKSYPRKTIWNKIFKLCLWTFVLIVICTLPTAFILGELGPPRSLLILSLVFTTFFAALFTLLGMVIVKEKIISRINYFALSVSIIFLIYELIYQYHVTKIYAEAYDDRIVQLNQLKKDSTNSSIKVAPLPDCGMLYNAEYSTDTAYFVNQHWKMGLALNFNVAKAE